MKHIRTAGIAVFCIILALCGCSGESTAPSASIPWNASPEGSLPDEKTVPIELAKKEENGDVYHLISDRIMLPDPDGCETAQCLFADQLILAEQTGDGAKLFALSADDEAVELAVPDDTEYIFAICETNTGFAALCGSYPAIYRDWEGNVIRPGEPKGRVMLAGYDENMELCTQVPLTSVYNGTNHRFIQMLRGENGFWLLSAELLVYVTDDGAECVRQEIHMSDGWRFAAIQLRGGKLYALALEHTAGTGAALWEYDRTTLEQTDTYEFPEECVTGMGASVQGGLLLNSTRGILEWDIRSGQTAQLVLWDELGTQLSGEQLQWTETGYLFYTPNQTAIEALQWVPGEPDSRRLLTMAVTTPDIATENVRELVYAFNTSQETYQVSFTTYSNVQSSDTQSNTLLQTQIMAGSGPDLFYFCSTGDNAEMPITPKRVCIDLTPYMETEGTKEQLVPNLYDLMTEEHALYQLPLTFVVDTLLAPSALIPEAGVTVTELEEVRKRAGEEWVTFEAWNTPENLLLLSAPFCIGKYVDQDTGSCNFQTQEFCDHLSWCRLWGGDGSANAGAERAILRYKRIYDLESLAGLGTRAKNWFGTEGYTYAGFPNETGSGSSYCLTSALGISSQCTDVEGAWEFVKFCFAYAGDHSSTLPANYEKLQGRMEQYIAGGQTDWRGEPVAISEADGKQFYALLETITNLRAMDDTIIQIMQEEAACYFAGQYTAEQTAEHIQTGVTLYWMEQ